MLTDFIRTGVYNRRRQLLKTQSPSMDILVSSNLERMLYMLSGDCSLVAQLMQQLNKGGIYTLPEELKEKIQEQFWAGCCDDENCRKVINKVWNTHHYLCDPHTAVGWAAAEEYQQTTNDKTPMVVLSTASPYKFPAAVLQALGDEDDCADEFRQMELLAGKTGVKIPHMLANLENKTEIHTSIIPKEEMPQFVLSL